MKRKVKCLIVELDLEPSTCSTYSRLDLFDSDEVFSIRFFRTKDERPPPARSNAGIDRPCSALFGHYRPALDEDETVQPLLTKGFVSGERAYPFSIIQHQVGSARKVPARNKNQTTSTTQLNLRNGRANHDLLRPATSPSDTSRLLYH